MSKQQGCSDLALQQVEKGDVSVTFSSVSFFSFSLLDPKSDFSFNVDVWLLRSVTLPPGLWYEHVLVFVPLPQGAC